MSDKTVQVSFTLQGQQWTFDPPVTPMKKPGKIKLQPKPGAAAWKFATADVVAGGSQFDVTSDPNGEYVTIDNRHTTLGTFAYTVTVTLDGTSYTSPGPGDGATQDVPDDQSLGSEPPPRIQNET